MTIQSLPLNVKVVAMVASSEFVLLAGATLIVAWIGVRTKGKLIPGVRSLVATWVLFGVACALIAARGQISDFYSIVIANSVMGLAYSLLSSSASRLFGRPPLFWVGGLAFCALFVFMACFVYIINDIGSRLIIMSLYFAAFNIALGRNLWRGDLRKHIPLWLGRVVSIAPFFYAGYNMARIVIVSTVDMATTPWASLFVLWAIFPVTVVAIAASGVGIVVLLVAHIRRMSSVAVSAAVSDSALTYRFAEDPLQRIPLASRTFFLDRH